MKNISCNNCGLDQHSVIFKGRDRLYKVDNKLFNYVKCLNCGLVFIDPQPESEELKRYYPEEYGPYRDNNEVFRYGPLSMLFKNLKQRLGKNSARSLTQDERILNYLDFGCGSGESLMSVKEKHHDWILYGLDNNEYACKKAKEKGFGVFCGDILKMEIPVNFFDTVNMGHVIEHLSDPKKTLLKINTIMKPGSEIIISTPNYDSWVAQFFRTYWYDLDAPRHLFLYTPITLERLLEDTGFIIEKIEFDKGPKVGIRSMYYLFGKKDLRINPFIWKLFEPVSYVLSKFGKTSIMTIHARKV